MPPTYTDPKTGKRIKVNDLATSGKKVGADAFELVGSILAAGAATWLTTYFGVPIEGEVVFGVGVFAIKALIRFVRDQRKKRVV